KGTLPTESLAEPADLLPTGFTERNVGLAAQLRSRCGVAGRVSVSDEDESRSHGVQLHLYHGDGGAAAGESSRKRVCPISSSATTDSSSLTASCLCSSVRRTT